MKIKITCRPRYNPWLKKYLNTKTFSKILALGILINSVPINSFAGILSEDGRYETFEGSDITINDVLEEDKVDVEIEGNTMVNVANQKEPTPITKSYTVENANHIPLQGEYDGKARPVIEGNTMYYNNDTGEYSDTFIEGANLSLMSSFEDQLVTQEMVNNGIEKAENLGKYKVEYKVTGKNKIDLHSVITSKPLVSTVYAYSKIYEIQLKPYTTYVVSSRFVPKDGVNFESTNFAQLLNEKNEALFPNHFVFHAGNNDLHLNNSVFTTGKSGKIRYGFKGSVSGKDYSDSIQIQIEEGNISTEYEPYKESIKTFYLNSPLLEGDTIEDIDGKATHVRRCKEIILNGSEQLGENNFTIARDNTVTRYMYLPNGKLSNTINSSFNNDKKSVNHDVEGIVHDGYDLLYIAIDKSRLQTFDTNGIKNWFQNNPTRVVYTLLNPIYETISDESILCDSYTNGHLDLNSNIPVNKVDFIPTNTNLNYLYPSTEYTIQFESDNEGKIDTVSLGDKVLYTNYSVNRGINRFNITTPSEILSTELILDGMEFNLSKLVVTEATDESFGYFEGMKSVGENDENGHNIEIVSANSDKTQFNKTKILLSEPLRGIPNGVKDKIIKRNGQWFIERNCGEVILDGSDDEWYRGESSVVYFTLNDSVYTNNNVPSISDKLQSLGANSFLNGDIGFWLQWRTTTYSYLYINTGMPENTISNVKTWLQSNPMTIVYQLAKPIYEPIKADLVAQLFKDTTHISTNSSIPANLKVIVDRTINRATEAIELAKTNPTIANLSKARYWTNLLKESTKKDELQEEINNNTDVVDLQLERKTTSANLDVYIKCENMLSMSLDTNQISFDDFSGIEDIEKINAVNVSINSSLPYQLNAYLPAEIQNSDKTKTLDKSILNIKESGESAYQAFTNINEKVVLKDNCSSGNQLTHSIDIMLKGGVAHEKDVYKAVIKLEAEQK